MACYQVICSVIRPRAPTDLCQVTDFQEKVAHHIYSIFQDVSLDAITTAPASSNFHISVERAVSEQNMDEKVRENNLVLCALISKTRANFSGADIFQSRVKLPYFWCNFCSFDTESKPNLLQHLVSEHCFLCYHCQYAAFSRNDVIQHSIREHPEFREQVHQQKLKGCYLIRDRFQCTFKPEPLKRQPAKRSFQFNSTADISEPHPNKLGKFEHSELCSGIKSEVQNVVLNETVSVSVTENTHATSACPDRETERYQDSIQIANRNFNCREKSVVKSVSENIVSSSCAENESSLISKVSSRLESVIQPELALPTSAPVCQPDPAFPVSTSVCQPELAVLPLSTLVCQPEFPPPPATSVCQPEPPLPLSTSECQPEPPPSLSTSESQPEPPPPLSTKVCRPEPPPPLSTSVSRPEPPQSLSFAQVDNSETVDVKFERDKEGRKSVPSESSRQDLGNCLNLIETTPAALQPNENDKDKISDNNIQIVNAGCPSQGNLEAETLLKLRSSIAVSLPIQNLLCQARNRLSELLVMNTSDTTSCQSYTPAGQSGACNSLPVSCIKVGNLQKPSEELVVRGEMHSQNENSFICQSNTPSIQSETAQPGQEELQPIVKDSYSAGLENLCMPSNGSMVKEHLASKAETCQDSVNFLIDPRYMTPQSKTIAKNFSAGQGGNLLGQSLLRNLLTRSRNVEFASDGLKTHKDSSSSCQDEIAGKITDSMDDFICACTTDAENIRTQLLPDDFFRLLEKENQSCSASPFLSLWLAKISNEEIKQLYQNQSVLEAETEVSMVNQESPSIISHQALKQSFKQKGQITVGMGDNLKHQECFSNQSVRKMSSHLVPQLELLIQQRPQADQLFPEGLFLDHNVLNSNLAETTKEAAAPLSVCHGLYSQLTDRSTIEQSMTPGLSHSQCFSAKTINSDQQATVMLEVADFDQGSFQVFKTPPVLTEDRIPVTSDLQQSVAFKSDANLESKTNTKHSVVRSSNGQNISDCEEDVAASRNITPVSMATDVQVTLSSTGLTEHHRQQFTSGSALQSKTDRLQLESDLSLRDILQMKYPLTSTADERLRSLSDMSLRNFLLMKMPLEQDSNATEIDVSLSYEEGFSPVVWECGFCYFTASEKDIVMAHRKKIHVDQMDDCETKCSIQNYGNISLSDVDESLVDFAPSDADDDDELLYESSDTDEKTLKEKSSSNSFEKAAVNEMATESQSLETNSFLSSAIVLDPVVSFNQDQQYEPVKLSGTNYQSSESAVRMEMAPELESEESGDSNVLSRKHLRISISSESGSDGENSVHSKNLDTQYSKCVHLQKPTGAVTQDMRKKELVPSYFNSVSGVEPERENINKFMELQNNVFGKDPVANINISASYKCLYCDHPQADLEVIKNHIKSLANLNGEHLLKIGLISQNSNICVLFLCPKDGCTFTCLLDSDFLEHIIKCQSDMLDLHVRSILSSLASALGKHLHATGIFHCPQQDCHFSTKDKQLMKHHCVTHIKCMHKVQNLIFLSACAAMGNVYALRNSLDQYLCYVCNSLQNSLERAHGHVQTEHSGEARGVFHLKQAPGANGIVVSLVCLKCKQLVPFLSKWFFHTCDYAKSANITTSPHLIIGPPAGTTHSAAAAPMEYEGLKTGEYTDSSKRCPGDGRNVPVANGPKSDRKKPSPLKINFNENSNSIRSHDIDVCSDEVIIIPDSPSFEQVQNTNNVILVSSPGLSHTTHVSNIHNTQDKVETSTSILTNGLQRSCISHVSVFSEGTTPVSGICSSQLACIVAKHRDGLLCPTKSIADSVTPIYSLPNSLPTPFTELQSSPQSARSYLRSLLEQPCNIHSSPVKDSFNGSSHSEKRTDSTSASSTNACRRPILQAQTKRDCISISQTGTKPSLQQSSSKLDTIINMQHSFRMKNKGNNCQTSTLNCNTSTSSVINLPVHLDEWCSQSSKGTRFSPGVNSSSQRGTDVNRDLSVRRSTPGNMDMISWLQQQGNQVQQFLGDAMGIQDAESHS